MKVILNKDLAPLGEEGDIKDVAKGYARNYLFPRNIAMPYTDRTVAILESRREAIEARKEDKRKDALGLKERLETLEMVIVMPAGANGRLYGAVTGQTVADELTKQGFQIERKRIELPGNTFKSVGKYKVTVKLYESAAAEVSVAVEGQPLKVETPSAPRRDRRRRDEEAQETAAGEAQETAVPAEALETAPVEAQEAAPEEALEAAPEEALEAAPEEALETAAPVEAQEAAPEEALETAAPAEAQETDPAEDSGNAAVEASAPEPVQEESAAET